MTEAEARIKYPTVLGSDIAALFLKQKADPDFDLKTWLETFEQNALAKKKATEMNQELIAEKLEKQGVLAVGYFNSDGEQSYVAAMLSYPFRYATTQLAFDDAEHAVGNLAFQIIAGKTAAVAYAQAYESVYLAQVKYIETRRDLLKYLALASRIEISDKELDARVLSESANKLLSLIESEPSYQESIEKLILAEHNLEEIYNQWFSTTQFVTTFTSPRAPQIPSKSIFPSESADSYPIWTGQETDCLIRSAGDGQRGVNWENQNQRGIRVWEAANASHRIELSPETELDNCDALDLLTQNQNSDFALAFNYIVGILCPPIRSEQQKNIIAGYIDLNDVLGKIGWLNDKPNAHRREQLRSRLWDFIRFAAQAKVNGERSIPYKDKVTGFKINTYIQSSVWQINDCRFPESSAVPFGYNPAPLQIFVTISPQWQLLLSDPNLAQFYPCGELLGKIPSNQPSGDWARIIGLTLARVWRIHPRKTLECTFSPTRRQLLSRFIPKTKTLDELLDGEDPKRAVKYYLDALDILREIGLIEMQGDALKGITSSSMLKCYGRQGWQKPWADSCSNLYPGREWFPVISEREAALPHSKPKILTKER